MNAAGARVGLLALAWLLVAARGAALAPSACVRTLPCQITNTTSSALVQGGRDPSVLQVLPPSTGVIAPERVKPADNVRYCDEMLDLQATSRALSASIAELLWSAADVDEQLAELQRQRASWLRIAADHAHAPESAAYRQAVQRARELEVRMASIQGALDAQLAGLLARRQQLLDLYRHYARLLGAEASFSATTRWRDNLAQLRRDNPGVAFALAETRDARLDLALVPGIGSDAYLASLPSVLGYLLEGRALDPADPTRTLPAFPERLQVDVQLSLVAACVQTAPARFDLEQIPGGGPIYAIDVAYEYAVRRPWRLIVRYNPYQIYLQIAERAALGFVQKKRLADALIGAPERTGIELRWPADDTTPSAERTRIEQAARDELLFEVLRLWGEPHYDPDLPFADGGPDPWLDEPSLLLPRAPALDVLAPITADSQHAALFERVSLSPGQDVSGAITEIASLAVERPSARAASLSSAALDTAAPCPLDSALASASGTSTAAPKVDASAPQRVSPVRRPTLACLEAPALSPTPRAVALASASALSDEGMRLVWDAVQSARRAINPLCGLVTPACEGVSWSLRPRPLGEIDAAREQALRQRFDRWLERRFGADTLTFRPATALFSPREAAP